MLSTINYKHLRNPSLVNCETLEMATNYRKSKREVGFVMLYYMGIEVVEEPLQRKMVCNEGVSCVGTTSVNF